MTRTIILTPRERRRKRIRAKVAGSESRPRLSIYKSNVAMYAQIINDETGSTIAAASSLKFTKGNKTEAAKSVGSEIAKLAKAKGVTQVVFDRGGFIFTGRVKALADAAREAGLEF